jgi:hypothetical protein
MYTLDEFIERMIELRNTAKAGGKTPVAVFNAGLSVLVPAEASLTPATPLTRGEEFAGWNSSVYDNTTEIVRVF